MSDVERRKKAIEDFIAQPKLTAADRVFFGDMYLVMTKMSWTGAAELAGLR